MDCESHLCVTAYANHCCIAVWLLPSPHLLGVVLYESGQVASGGGAPLQCRHLRLSDLRPGPAMEALLHMALGDGPGISEWWGRYNKAREARRQPGELQDHSLLHVAPVGGADER